MITPRAVRLVRVTGWQPAQRAIALLAVSGDSSAARDRAVIVPTHAAAAELRRTLDTIWLLEDWRPSEGDCARLAVEPLAPVAAWAQPALLTRAGLYDALHARLGSSERLLSPVEREVRLGLASDAAIAAGAAPPFTVRGGLLAEMLALYDALRRRKRAVDDFERVLSERLEPSSDTDRGARRLLEQTRYLVAAYRAYERGLAEDGLVDEHRLRERLAALPMSRPFSHLVITVADDVGEAHGLWPCDFDLLMRLDGLARIDIVATDTALSAGLRDRLEELLPGLEECRPRDLDIAVPLLVAPPAPAERLWFLYRDREHELAEVARRVKLQWDGPLEDVALVYQRPLPYLYLARQLLDAAGMPYEANDALPLAAEPYVASFDLVVSCVLSDFSRASVVALLGAPHFGWGTASRPVSRADLAAFDDALIERGFVDGAGELGRHLAEMESMPGPSSAHSPTARPARLAEHVREVLDALGGLARDAPASAHLGHLLEFLRTHDIDTRPGDAPAERLRRARAALHGVLEQLLDAHLEHGDRFGSLRDLVSMIRRWIEAHTFAPATGEGGLRFLDATAARYGTVSSMHLLGLVEGDWPEPIGRTVLYPPGVLKDLNWPREQDRVNAARAAFVDLARLARREVAFSAFTLEDDALVSVSTLVEDLDRAALPVQRLAAEPHTPVFSFEAMARRPPDRAVMSADAAAWLELRAARGDLSDPGHHGHVGAWPSEAHAVTAVEIYLNCPFKYFASKVLRLGEEVDETPMLSPLARGRFVHEVFQAFFTRWAEAGQVAVTPDTLPEAREVFERTVDELLPRVPAQDRALERARLLGSPASPGMGDRILHLEAGHEAPVVERLLEQDLRGTYTLTGASGTREVGIRGIADRIDLLADGTLRVIDYKTGQPPDLTRALQLPIYAVCAEQSLAGYRGHDWQVSAAAYVAFGSAKTYVPVIASAAERDAALASGQARFLETIERIGRGEFPPQPAEARLCRTCAFAAVCRKDVRDDD